MTRFDEPTRILGIAGSLRASSYNRMLLHAARDAAPDDVEIVVWDRLKVVPPFDEDDEQEPAAVVGDLRACIAAAHGVLIVTPEYNGSLPGQLKNALDWASRPRQGAVLIDKPVAVMGASPSPGGARHAQADARRVLGRAGARVLDLELAIARAYEPFTPDGQLIDAELRARLGVMMRALADSLTSALERPGGDREPAFS